MAKRPNPELVSYIEKHLSKGFKIRHIKRKLAEVGHPIEAIEDAASYVTQQHPRKKPAAFMIVYGLVLLVAIVLFAWFIITKATQQLEYRETVKDIEERQSYLGMTDVELIKLAAAGDMKACDHITGHNIQYACLEKYWERGDCSYEALLGQEDQCWFDKAVASEDLAGCYNIEDFNSSLDCRDEIVLNFAEENNPEKCKGDEGCLFRYIGKKGIGELGASFCERFSDNLKDECLLMYVENTGDKEACNSMYNASDAFDCLSSVLESFEGAVGICQDDFNIFLDEPTESPQDIEFAKASCFLAASTEIMDNKNIDCQTFLAFVDANLDSDIVNSFSETYKYHKAHPEEFSETFFECV